jgi:transcriptional regulator EpsA
MQNQVQHFLPHEILISAWGDFSLDLTCYDIVSPLPGFRTEEFDEKSIKPFIGALFRRWEATDHSPYTLQTSEGFNQESIQNPVIIDAMKRMRCALVHGIKDQRGRHDCLYVFLGPDNLGEPRAREALRFLLPYIDTSFRQIAHLPDQYFTEPTEILDPGLGLFAIAGAEPKDLVEDDRIDLSTREDEIMHWVRLGKTNQEVGQILDISSFTVKNHLQRIFKKLNVLNRAQAVAKTEKNK